MLQSISSYSFQAMAHLDFPRRYFDSWEIPEKTINSILELMIKKEILLEINTSSISNDCSQVRRNNIHVVTGAHSLFLLLDLGTVKLCDGVLDRLDCGSLVNRLNVHGHNLRGLHIEEISQHTVTQVRCGNRQIGHGY